MAYGIHVENPSGQVQIDQDYTNYYEVASTSFYLNAGAQYYDMQSGSLSITGYTARVDDIIAINTGNQYRTGGLYVNGSTVYYNMWMDTAGTVNVKIYRRMDDLTAAGSGYGLEVYKADGTTLAFSSNYKPMRIAALITGSPPFSSSSGSHSGYTPYATANTAYVLASSDPPDGPFSGISEWQTVSANSTTVYTTYSEELGAYAPASYFYSGTVTILVLKG